MDRKCLFWVLSQREFSLGKSSLPFLPVAELASLLKSSGISAVELTQAYLARITRIKGIDLQLKGYITGTSQGVMQQARSADQEIMMGNYLGHIYGVPVALKDQMWTKGIPTTNGSTLLKDFIPMADAYEQNTDWH